MDNEKNFNSAEELEQELEITADLITLIDEDGESHEFELVDTLEHNGSSYVALLAVAETPEEVLEFDGNLVIMKIVTDEVDETEVLSLIEDDDEFDEISDIFMDRLADLYEFDVEDDE